MMFLFILLKEIYEEWILSGSVNQLVMAIISKDTRITLERWVFDIMLVEPPSEGSEQR